MNDYICQNVTDGKKDKKKERKRKTEFNRILHDRGPLAYFAICETENAC